MVKDLDEQIVTVLQAAQKVIDKTEESRREMVAAWQKKERAYRLMVREMAYQMTIGMAESAAHDRMTLWGLDWPLIMEVLEEHQARHEKDEANSR